MANNNSNYIYNLKNELRGLLKRIKKGTLFGNDFELTEQVDELFIKVENIKNVTQIATNHNKVENKNNQDEILKESEKDPKLGLIRLAKELEKECKELMFQTGWHDNSRITNIKQSFNFLTENGLIPLNTSSTVNLFLEIRNNIIHQSEVVKNDEILRVIDLGLTLLNTIQSIPREIKTVYKTNIDLYTDDKLTNIVEKGKGVILESISPGKSIKSYSIHPTTKNHLSEGSKVTWEWSFDNIWNKCFYTDPVSGEVKSAWDRSAEFIGRDIDKLQ